MDSYFRSLAADLEQIRMSVPWLNLCGVVQKTIKAQNLTMVFNPKEKHSVAQQAIRAATLIGPLSLPRNFFTKSLLMDHSGIRVNAGRLLQTIFDKINEFHTILMKHPKASVYSETEKNEIFAAFKSIFVLNNVLFVTQLLLSLAIFFSFRENFMAGATGIKVNCNLSGDAHV